ncbi:hypothetical protein [Candidatus Nitrosocosmicus sp. R]
MSPQDSKRLGGISIKPINAGEMIYYSQKTSEIGYLKMALIKSILIGSNNEECSIDEVNDATQLKD